MADSPQPENAPAAARTPAVCFQGVDFSYDGALVLEDADFDIFRGESVCVVGPNGGGKTTLLKLILGLLEPDAGSVAVLGSPPKAARGRIGYVPQRIEFDPFFPVTVLDVVLTGLLAGSSLGFAPRADRERAAEKLAGLGLGGLERAAFASLSGGQRQAVLIARALVSEPELLLLDEPTAHVDVAAEERLHQLLRELAEGITLVTVSHDLAFVSRSVPKVVCVNREVHVHPTVELTGERLRRLYGYEVGMVQHGHEHLDSHGRHRHG
jgi:zinc transport system ATP-binding protein